MCADPAHRHELTSWTGFHSHCSETDFRCPKRFAGAVNLPTQVLMRLPRRTDGGKGQFYAAATDIRLGDRLQWDAAVRESILCRAQSDD
jgi:hypothetical protein